MPVASCPRCCSACRPSAVTAAASGTFQTPKTPHSSCSESSSAQPLSNGIDDKLLVPDRGPVGCPALGRRTHQILGGGFLRRRRRIDAGPVFLGHLGTRPDSA